MGLVDGAGAADDGGEAGLLEQAGLGAVGDDVGPVGPGEEAQQGLDLDQESDPCLILNQ